MSVLRREPRVVYRVYSQQEYLADADTLTDCDARPPTCVEDTRRHDRRDEREGRRDARLATTAEQSRRQSSWAARGSRGRPIALVAALIFGAVAAIALILDVRPLQSESQTAEVRSPASAQASSLQSVRRPGAVRVAAPPITDGRVGSRTPARHATNRRRSRTDGARRNSPPHARVAAGRHASLDRASDADEPARLTARSVPTGPKLGGAGSTDRHEFGFER